MPASSKPSGSSSRVDIRIPESLKAAFFEACEVRGLRPSEEIRRLIEQRLEGWRRDDLGRALELLEGSRDPAVREALAILRRSGSSG